MSRRPTDFSVIILVSDVSVTCVVSMGRARKTIARVVLVDCRNYNDQLFRTELCRKLRERRKLRKFRKLRRLRKSHCRKQRMPVTLTKLTKLTRLTRLTRLTSL